MHDQIYVGISNLSRYSLTPKARNCRLIRRKVHSVFYFFESLVLLSKKYLSNRLNGSLSRDFTAFATRPLLYAERIVGLYEPVF